MKKQASIFDYDNELIKNKIISNLEYYGIDEIYKKKDLKGCTFSCIYEELSKNNKYFEYLDKLSNELKKYLYEGDPYEGFYDKKEYSIFLKQENCIIIYSFKERSIGPIYCAEMLNNRLFEMEW